MQAKLLKRLADVGEIAKLDITENAVLLYPEGSATLAEYHGSYQACRIKVAGRAVDQKVAVSPARLRAVLDLFGDDADVSLLANQNNLILQAKAKKATLMYDTRVPVASVALDSADQSYLKVDRGLLSAEVALAGMVSSKVLTSPILTGIRMIGSVKNQAVAVQAADGVRMVFQSRIPAKVTNEMSLVVPAVDFQAAMKLMDDDDIQFCYQEGSQNKQLVMRSGTAAVVLPLLQGNWPNTGQLAAHEYQDAISLSAESVRSLAAAVRLYAAGDTATLRPSEGSEISTPMIIMETPAGEYGKFQDLLTGSLTTSYALPVDALTVASKISDGDVSMNFGKGLAMVKHDHRTLYVSLNWK